MKAKVFWSVILAEIVFFFFSLSNAIPTIETLRPLSTPFPSRDRRSFDFTIASRPRKRSYWLACIRSSRTKDAGARNHMSCRIPFSRAMEPFFARERTSFPPRAERTGTVRSMDSRVRIGRGAPISNLRATAHCEKIPSRSSRFRSISLGQRHLRFGFYLRMANPTLTI